ncbi:hypothetical protein [Kocuria sp. KH4]
MKPLTLDQLAAKVLYLEQENALLRAESLDLKVRAGLIRLSDATADSAPQGPQDGLDDG